jgi:hypothetical protein
LALVTNATFQTPWQHENHGDRRSSVRFRCGKFHPLDWHAACCARLAVITRAWGSSIRGAAVVLLSGVIATTASAAAADMGQPQLGGRLVVRERAGLGRAALQRALAKTGAARVDELAQLGATIVQVPEHELRAAQAALRRSGLFISVEPDYIATIAEAPNDPYYNAQWALARIGAESAWEHSSGAGVVVAVVDTGVEAGHPDLQGQLLAGYDYINNDGDPADDHGHGTRMTGIIVARRNNALGGAGIAPDARVIPIKALDHTGNGPYSAVASGIVYAVDHGARVINLSLVGPSQSTVMQNAVDYAVEHDVVVVAASGNYGTNVPGYPAAAPGAVAVGATNDFDSRASFSVYGAWLSFAAPGVEVLTTTLNGDYTGSTGTSPAAAVGSAIFALLFGANPNMPRAEAIARVQDGAVDVGPDGWDPYYGWGRADAYAALVPGQSSTPPPDGTAPTISVLSPTKGSLVWGMVPVDIAANDNVGIARVELWVDGQWYAQATAPPYSFVVDAAELSPGKHKLRAYAYDTSGNWSRTKSHKLMLTPGAGMLVKSAVAKPTSLSIKAQFALPDGIPFDPMSNAMTLELTAGSGTVLSATAEAGTFTVNSTGKMRGTLSPDSPGDGTVRMTAKHTGTQPIYTIKIKATDLSGMASPQALMNLALNLDGIQLSQSLTFRAKPSGALVYP